MVAVLASLLHSLRFLVRSRAALHLEILVLRHQLSVVRRSRRPRLRLTAADRMLWAVRGSKRRELEGLFAANRRLFKAYVLREQLDRLWTYKTRRGVLDFLLGWIRALRWQRLPEMARL